MTTTYNGWKNRETWLVGLWASNDPCFYRMAREGSAEDFRVSIEEYCEVYNTGLSLDLIQYALSDVDFDEIYAFINEGEDSEDEEGEDSEDEGIEDCWEPTF